MQSPGNSITQQPETAFQSADNPIVHQIWKLTRLLYLVIISALIDISLPQMLSCLPLMSARLEKWDDMRYCRQTESFRELLQQGRIDSKKPPLALR